MQGKNKTQYIRDNIRVWNISETMFNMNQQKNINQWKDITSKIPSILFNYLYRNIKSSTKQRSDPLCPLMSKNIENF